jgi:hypothetical protein
MSGTLCARFEELGLRPVVGEVKDPSVTDKVKGRRPKNVPTLSFRARSVMHHHMEVVPEYRVRHEPGKQVLLEPLWTPGLEIAGVFSICRPEPVAEQVGHPAGAWCPEKRAEGEKLRLEESPEPRVPGYEVDEQLGVSVVVGRIWG